MYYILELIFDDSENNMKTKLLLCTHYDSFISLMSFYTII